MESREQLPVQVVDRLLGSDCKVRVAIAAHPVTGEEAPCVPYKDYAGAFTYDAEVIRKMVDRTEWLKKHSTTVIMEAVDGKYRPQTCMFEEAMIGVFMKLQPQRCKDPMVAAHVNERQEAMVLLLRDVMRGYRKKEGFCDEDLNMLPRPGLSMAAVPQLCKQANKGDRFSAKALSYFYGMPVDDLMQDVFTADPTASEGAPLIVQHFEAIMKTDGLKGIKKDETAFSGFSNDVLLACNEMSSRYKLPKFCTSVHSFGATLGREKEAIEFYGWRRIWMKKVGGYDYYRYEKVMN